MMIRTLCLWLLVPAASLAQPVIEGPSQLPPAGYFTHVGIRSLPSPGPVGANQTWDFTGLSPMAIGPQVTVEPDSTPYADAYPDATHAWFVLGLAGRSYSLFDASSGGLDVIAEDVFNSTTSDDFTPDPQRILTFPFAFGQSFTDTFQRVGGSSDTIRVTYDAYGTVHLPSGTYTDVIRTEQRTSDRTDYVFWTTNPLNPLLIWSHGGANVTVFERHTASVDDDRRRVASTVHPNPARGSATISVPSLVAPARLRLVDAIGTTVREMTLEQSETIVDLDGIARGVYRYEIIDGRAVIAGGGLVVE